MCFPLSPHTSNITPFCMLSSENEWDTSGSHITQWMRYFWNAILSIILFSNKLFVLESNFESNEFKLRFCHTFTLTCTFLNHFTTLKWQGFKPWQEDFLTDWQFNILWIKVNYLLRVAVKVRVSCKLISLSSSNDNVSVLPCHRHLAHTNESNLLTIKV